MLLLFLGFSFFLLVIVMVFGVFPLEVSGSFQQMVALESPPAKAHLRFVEIHAAYQEVSGVAGSASGFVWCVV